MIYMQGHDGWDSLYLENHDQPRILGRWANNTTYRVQAAKMPAMFHATGRGTLFIYQGQEIGMANASWTVEELKDVEEINYYNAEKVERAEGADMSDALAQIQRIVRDSARMPVSWDDNRERGIHKGHPVDQHQ